jgi:hypothetical protein
MAGEIHAVFGPLWAYISFPLLFFLFFFLQYWYDEFLMWNSSEYNIKETVCVAEDIWLPDFGISNRLQDCIRVF